MRISSTGEDHISGVDQINSVRADRTPDNATREDHTPGILKPNATGEDLTYEVDKINSVRENHTSDKDITKGQFYNKHPEKIMNYENKPSKENKKNSSAETEEPNHAKERTNDEQSNDEDRSNIEHLSENHKHGSDEPQQKNKRNPILRLKKSKMLPRTNHLKDSRGKSDETTPNG